MVKHFQFARIPRILFGNGMVEKLPGIIKGYGKNIIIVTGKESFVSSVYSEKLLADIESFGISVHLIPISGEPSPDDIDKASKRFQNKDVDLVIGIGGGSAIDAGKAISAMIGKPESVTEFLEGVGNREHPGTKIPYIAVPTTSGTGSEATKNAVISKIGADGFKRSLRHENLVPDIALVDPDLTLNCSPDITAASGMDCLTQLTEAYLSIRAIPYTDALAPEGLKAVKDSLEKSYSDGSDREARAGMSFAALTSGICLANAGLGTVHGFASSLGGMFEIPHGVVCGSLMAKTNEINVRQLRKSGDNPAALMKYAHLGELFLDERGRDADYYIEGFISYLHSLTEKFRLPGLKDYGITEDSLTQICLITENKNNPVKLTPEDLTEILESRLLI
jgi:alcohol dehydrogenase class IV